MDVPVGPAVPDCATAPPLLALLPLALALPALFPLHPHIPVARTAAPSIIRLIVPPYCEEPVASSPRSRRWARVTSNIPNPAESAIITTGATKTRVGVGTSR